MNRQELPEGMGAAFYAIMAAAIVFGAIIAFATTCRADEPSGLDDDIRRLAPDRAYAMAAWTGDTTHWAVGGDWATTSWTGIGVEYRRFEMQLGRHHETGHGLALRGYAVPVRFGRLGVLTEAGVGAASDIDLTINPVPLVGARAGLVYDVTSRWQVRAMVGGMWTGKARLSHGTIRQAWNLDAAIGVALVVDDDVLALIRRYRP